MIKRIVIIKTWDRMVKEFGLDDSGDIDCHSSFTVEMKDFVPPHRVIEIVQYYKDTAWIWELKDIEWIISEDMIASELKK